MPIVSDSAGCASDMLESVGNVSTDTSNDDRSAWPDWLKKHITSIEGGPVTDEFKLLLKKFVMLEASLGFPMGKVCGCCSYPV